MNNPSTIPLGRDAPIGALLRNLWRHLSRRRRRQFVLVLGLMMLSAFAELVSLSAVLPFLAVLTSPERVFGRPGVAQLVRSWGINTPGELVLPLTIAFATLSVVAGAVRILMLWSNTRFAFATGADLSIEMYSRTLYQQYAVHVGRNSSEVISGITSKVHNVVFGVLVPVLTLFSSLVLVTAIATALIAFNPTVALAATAVFAVCYGLIGWAQRRRLHSNSRRIADAQTQVIKALQEGLGGIRDVLLDGTQAVYRDTYSEADLRLRRAQASNVFMTQSPRYATEALGMVLIAALTYALSRQHGGISAALPLLGALALGAQRLLPAMQQAHGAWTDIGGHRVSLADALSLLEQRLPAGALDPPPPALVLRESIGFQDIYFRYSSEGPWVLSGFDLTIHKGARVGFVGTTGSGKSTAVDLLMGLLPPSAGRLLVDGEPLTGERARAWQRTIAHVPQTIYLADASLAENIAFGTPRADIDQQRMRDAARQAQIADFIESHVDAYEMMVGERGVRLSGGQRQRIGIARALYKQATVLVFDEATSALDSATEQSVMDAITQLSDNLTILMIAHRLTTVRHCDLVVELRDGRVIAQGSYDELLRNSASFRQLAHVT